MARVVIRSVDENAGGQAVLSGASDPIHLNHHRLSPGARLAIAPGHDSAGYVWRGGVTAAGRDLPAGSSFVVGHGAALDITAGADGAQVLLFHAPGVAGHAGSGRVHLMPTDRVPRYAPPPGEYGASGGLHFNAEGHGCPVWLHENQLPGMEEGASDVAERSVHAHSEDEVIVVTAGSMRLGARLVGPGTALAIAADTFYSFTPGPGGLDFINFRPGFPAAFRMKNGGSFDEAGYWRERVAPPQPITI